MNLVPFQPPSGNARIGWWGLSIQTFDSRFFRTDIVQIEHENLISISYLLDIQNISVTWCNEEY